jgi:hypothetical protein
MVTQLILHWKNWNGTAIAEDDYVIIMMSLNPSGKATQLPGQISSQVL